MASRYVELLWDLGSHTLTEINAMVKKILTVCDMKLLLHGAMRHIEVEEQDLVWYAHTPCPVAAAVVGIVMDLYHLLTSSSIEMSFSAHVITGEPFLLAWKNILECPFSLQKIQCDFILFLPHLLIAKECKHIGVES